MKNEIPLHTISLTVNNICNMGCEHCYLSFKNSTRDYICEELVGKIYDTDFNHLAIVGKEPLFDKIHAKKTRELINKFFKKGISISMITNGKNLHLLNAESLKKISHLDVSFDGGPKTYSNNRQASSY